MKKNNIVIAILLLVVFGCAAQASVVVTTATGNGADAGIQNDSTALPSVNNGASNTVVIRHYDGTRAKAGIYRFNISGVAGDLTGSTLSISTGTTANRGRTMNIYGLIDGAGELWTESTVCYNNAPGMVIDPMPAYGYITIDVTKWSLLGTMAFASTANFTNTGTVDLSSLFNADTNGVISLFLYTASSDNSQSWNCWTKEHTDSALFPKLTFPNAVLSGIRDPQPAGSTVNTNLLTQLTWTLNAPNIFKCDVYFGTEPNRPDMDKLTFNPAVASVTINDFPSYETPLPEGKYYWCVDCYDDPNTEPNLPGRVWSFNVVALPVVTQHPANQFKFAGETAAFTVSVTSNTTVTYAWYKSADNANNTAADDVSVGTNSNTLSIPTVALANAGYYFCKAANPGGEVLSNTARLSIKRQLVHLALDGNTDDSSGNGLNGSLFGEPNYVSSVSTAMGQALTFDGSTNYVTEPNSTVDFSDFVPGMTILVWAKPSAAGNWARFIDFANGAGSDNIYLARNGTSTNLSLNIYAGATSTGIVTANGVIALNEWQMFVATVDEARNVVLYKNGVPVRTDVTISQVPNVINRTRNYIGRSNWGTDALYAGLMDDIQIWNYPITADAIANMYSGVVGNYCRYRPTYDWDNTCKVDVGDIALLAGQWLNCGLYPECP